MRIENELGRILKQFRIDFHDSWGQLPNRAFFFILLAAWLAVFHFVFSVRHSPQHTVCGLCNTPSRLGVQEKWSG